MASIFLQSTNFIDACYIVAFSLFIYGMSGLTGPRTAVRGNMIAAVGALDQAKPLFVEWLRTVNVLIDMEEAMNQKLSAEARDAVEVVCSIAQFGSTRSINAGVAAGIAMHAWIRRWAAPDV